MKQLFLPIAPLLFSAVFGLTSCREKPLFERLPSSKTGITFTNTITESDSLNVLDFEYIYNGGGVGVGDFNSDGLPDVFFTGNQVPNRLYLNKGGLTFDDVTEKAGLLEPHYWSTGVSLVDINADGRLDIYVCTINPKRGREGAPNLFYINQGNGPDGVPRFREMAREMGLDDRGYSTHAAFFDYDKDNDLDCYILTNALESYNRNQPRGPVRDGSGKSTDRLYRNEGAGGEAHGAEGMGQRAERKAHASRPLPSALRPSLFKNVSREAGITIEGWGLGVAVADINDDGWPDVYCADDFQSNDLLWINQRDGTFRNQLPQYTKHQSYNAMGLDVADLNNDGLPELMTLDMMPEDNRRQKSMFLPQNVDRYKMGIDQGYSPQFVRNVLQLNRGKDPRGQTWFSEVGQLSGVYATDWSWSTLMADFDNDGFRDILVTNGYPKDITDLDFVAYNIQYQSNYFNADARTDDETRRKMEELIGVKKSNFMFRNRGSEPGGTLQFEDVTEAWGLKIPSFSNGAAYADFDNDGDLDLVVNNIDDEAFVYQNTLDERRNNRENKGANFLRIRLEGDQGNVGGLGAKVSIRYGSSLLQAIENSPYRGYKSTVEPTLHFGLGGVSRVDTVLVRWLDGRVSRLTNVPANQVITIRQRQGLTESIELGSGTNPAPFFEELKADNPISFIQQENYYVDFKEQVLLPHRYSQNGPGMAVGDVDGNGLDDVFIGGASTFDRIVFRQMKPGLFSRTVLQTDRERKRADDMGAVFFDADGDRDLDLYVVSGGNEWFENQPPYQDRLYRNDGKGNFREDTTALPDTRASGSCVVAADYDRDGDLDLFVGGRVTPRKYPMPPQSYLLENQGGRFRDVTDRVAPGLSRIGMVTAALWTDPDNDGWPDLLLTGEFMPLSLFKNKRGTSFTARRTVHSPGWWNSLTGGDFDSDGDIDYVAGNLGLNSRFKASEKEPLSIYVKDYDQNGTLDPILCQYIQGKCYPAHPRDQLAEQVPGMKRRFPSYAEYGQMTFEEILTDDERAGSYVAEATELRSCYFENKDGDFILHPLPMEAQVSPVYGLLAKDYDGDGNLDVLLVGNSYATDTQVGRYDAGMGLLLRGDGRGGFSPVSLAKSGFCADRDAKSLVEVPTGDGRSLLLVGNNSDTLQAFRQLRAPGRFVALRPGEYAALWKRSDGRVQRAEVYMGSGYLSQSAGGIWVGRTAGPVTLVNFRGQRRKVTF